MIKRNPALGAALAVPLLLAGCGSGHGDHAAVAGDPGAASAAASAMDSSMPGMDHSNMTPAQMAAMSDEGDGRSASRESYTLGQVSTPKKAGSGELAFTILGPKGKPHKEFVLELTKLMHVYVVREDLTAFQHLHPELNEATGRWTAPVSLKSAGPYRLVTEFDALTPDGDLQSRRLGTTFSVRGNYDKVPFEPSVGTGAVAGYDVAVSGDPVVGPNALQVTVRQGGQDVTALQPYLASWAHITGFRNGDLKVVHVHPEESPETDKATGGPTLSISPSFPTAGTYRLFVQFKVGDVVRTVPVDLKVR